ncbi:MAG: dual specificity protein phosphatase family protein [Gemmataceae bacterium]
MRPVWKWAFVALVALAIVGVPFLNYRANYAHHKRLRDVDVGVLYRSGEMTAEGFRDAIRARGIRTVINCQNEFPDPVLPQSYWIRNSIRESELCRELGVRYVHLDPDLCDHRLDPRARPNVIDRYLDILDDPANHPVLLHCKAGLHRTGCLAAIYRMQYDGWGPRRALDELKAHGFGDSAATSANDYVRQYILNFVPRVRGQVGYRTALVEP